MQWSFAREFSAVDELLLEGFCSGFHQRKALYRSQPVKMAEGRKERRRGKKPKCPTCETDLLSRTSLTAFKIQLRYHCHGVPVRNKPKLPQAVFQEQWLALANLRTNYAPSHRNSYMFVLMQNRHIPVNRTDNNIYMGKNNNNNIFFRHLYILYNLTIFIIIIIVLLL